MSTVKKIWCNQVLLGDLDGLIVGVHSYYFGRISREDANDVLMNHPRDGSFLLRMSATKEGV